MTENSPLVFNYADIKAEDGLRVTLTPDPADYADLFDRPGTLKNLTLELEFTVGGNSILLAGSVTGELELECSRCAEPVTRSYTDSFDEDYPDTVEYIDTREVIRETVGLLAPLKVLCSADCKGRCLVCGIDRNKKTCGCSSGNPNAFNVLKKLKIEKPEK